MAAWLDLRDRCAAINAGAVYVAQPSRWLLALCDDARQRPIVINTKGTKPDDIVIVLTLAEYERLHGATTQGVAHDTR